MFLLFFPRFHRPSQEQAGNGVGSKLHQPTFHLREVLAGGHDVIHKKDIASLKIDGMENKVGELIEAVSTFHLLTVFPYPCGTEAIGDFQAMRKEAAKPGETGGVALTGGCRDGDKHGIGRLFLVERHTGDAEGEDFGDESRLLSFLEAEDQIAGLAVFHGNALAARGVIVMDVEAQCAVDAHLALETGVVGEEPAHEIAVEGEAEDVAPKGERGLILHAIDLAVDALLVGQTDADAQAVIESVLRYDVPVEGLAYPHDVALPAAQEIKRVVGLLDYQELAGHLGEDEVVANLGFGYFIEGNGYVEVFYHLWGFFCPKIRVWRIQNEPCPVYFTDKPRFCGISVFRFRYSPSIGSVPPSPFSLLPSSPPVRSGFASKASLHRDVLS